MNLLCRLGRHRPRGIPRWNEGYYFATCERCGRDLVRTAFQRWHVPDGYRVVWSDRPPASRPEVALVPGEKSAPASSGLPEARPGPAHEPDSPAAISPPEPPQDPLPVPAAPSPPAFPAEAPAPAQAAGPDDGLPADAPVPPAPSRNGRLPIQDVLAQLKAEDAAHQARVTVPAPTEAETRRRRSTWDFMDDGPLGGDAASGLAPIPRTPARPSAHGLAPAADAGEGEAVSSTGPGARGSEMGRRIRLAVRDFWSGPGEPKPVLVTALALAIAVGAALVLTLALPSAPSSSGDPPASSRPGGDRGAGMEGVADPFAADAGLAEPQAETAGRRQPGNPAPESPAQSPAKSPPESPDDRRYVVASLLSCRNAPALQARRVRNLARGQEVRVLGYEGEWASLTYRGGQCWAQTQFISPVPPL
ncbi:MAG TPA: hypothetical protein VGA98_08560 [Allosphingosinicella sp.]